MSTHDTRAPRPAAPPLADLQRVWPGIVGMDLGAVTRPVAIDGDVLVVQTDGAEASQLLSFLEPEIVRANPGIARLRFRVVPKSDSTAHDADVNDLIAEIDRCVEKKFPPDPDTGCTDSYERSLFGSIKTALRSRLSPGSEATDDEMTGFEAKAREMIRDFDRGRGSDVDLRNALVVALGFMRAARRPVATTAGALHENLAWRPPYRDNTLSGSLAGTPVDRVEYGGVTSCGRSVSGGEATDLDPTVRAVAEGVMAWTDDGDVALPAKTVKLLARQVLARRSVSATPDAPHDACEHSRDCIACGKRIGPANGLCFSCATTDPKVRMEASRASAPAPGGGVPAECPTCVQRCKDGECDLTLSQTPYHGGCDGHFCAHGICQECGSQSNDDDAGWLGYEAVLALPVPMLPDDIRHVLEGALESAEFGATPNRGFPADHPATVGNRKLADSIRAFLASVPPHTEETPHGE